VERRSRNSLGRVHSHALSQPPDQDFTRRLEPAPTNENELGHAVVAYGRAGRAPAKWEPLFAIV
jgi:hypothetical protein